MPAVLRTKSTMDIADPSAQSWTREYEPLVDDYRYPNYEDSEDTDTEEDEWDLEDSPNRAQVLQDATCGQSGCKCSDWCSGIGQNGKMLNGIFWSALVLGVMALTVSFTMTEKGSIIRNFLHMVSGGLGVVAFGTFILHFTSGGSNLGFCSWSGPP